MFRLLGFPVHVRAGFVMFMVLIVVLYGGEFGLWLAGSLAVFTLIHELGHAVAARRRRRRRRDLPQLPGRLRLVSPDPTDLPRWSTPASRSPARPSRSSSASPSCSRWASTRSSASRSTTHRRRGRSGGPARSSGCSTSSRAPARRRQHRPVGTRSDRRDRSHRWMLYFSLAMTGRSPSCFTSDRARGLFVFVGFLLVTQLQMLGSMKEPRHRGTTPTTPSRRPGRKARRILANPEPHRPDATPIATTVSAADMAAALIDLLPDPLPYGDPLNEYVLANQLIRIGRFEDAAHYARGFQRHPQTLSAATVARAAAHSAIRPRRSGGCVPPPTSARCRPAWRTSSTTRPSWRTSATIPR